MARSLRFSSLIAIAALACATTASTAYNFGAWMVTSTVTAFNWAFERVTSGIARVVAAFKQDRLQRPARVALVQACARALSLAKRDNIVVREGSWRMCPSI